MSAGERLLELRGLACVRGGRLLFDGLDLKLEPGEAALVTGANGAGKSSLLRLAGGLLRPAAGEVLRAPGTVAFADERLALDSKATLAGALGFWARLDGVPATPGIEAMGLSHLAGIPVRMLSTGQRKRATLARAVASGARLWLLDEPANGLDSEGLDRLASAMDRHRLDGGAILAASHQPIGLESAKAIAL